MLGKAISSRNYFRTRTLKPTTLKLNYVRTRRAHLPLYGMPKIVGIPSFEMTSSQHQKLKKNLFLKVLSNYTRKINEGLYGFN